MIVAGLGFRRGTSAPDICAVIAAALECHGLAQHDLMCLATEAAKAGEPGIKEAADRLSLPLIECALSDLRKASERTLTHSFRVEALKGVPSIAETAALVAAGCGARLLGPRIAHDRATCALAYARASAEGVAA